MAPVFSVLLMTNNYCHDIAAAMLMASGVAMWVIIRRLEDAGGAEALSLLFYLYAGISKVVTFSLLWIAAGAVPRILTFSTFEFAGALADNRLGGLMARHVLSLAMTLGGAYFWIFLIKRMKQIKGRSYIDV